MGSAGQGLAVAQPERLVGGPCEGCEAVFEHRPATFATPARIAPAGSAGEPLSVRGTVRDAQGRPAAGIVVYAYQTDAAGLYPRDDRLSGAARRHGAYRGFATTDAAGTYRFDTIRPGGYPGTSIPQHIHLHVVEPGRCTYYIDDIVFDDDPRLTGRERQSMVTGRGGPGLVQPVKDGATWKATRDITLGQGIRDYADCGKP
ncbi:MAG: hypothetical protein JNK75_09770 [Betaproteobacteria bacterium]|nr:hypothetical protein [Betaproteobacteria bacterium]